MRSTFAGCALLLALTACSDESLAGAAPLSVAPPRGAPAAPTAGSPPTAGSSALPATPNAPVVAPPAEATGAQIPDWCSEPLTVERLCSRPDAPCPSSPTEVRVQACMNKSIWGSAIPNGCGGTSVITRIGNSGRTWDFDGAGKLVALTSYDDTQFGPCRLNYYVYGQPCQLGEAQEDLCASLPQDPGAPDAG